MTPISILFAVILIIAIIMVVLLKKTSKPATWKPFIRTELKTITARTRPSDPMHLKAAIIDLDSLLDHGFKGLHLAGSTMGERLKAAKTLFDRDLYNSIWDAHKLRNRLVHEPTFRPRHGQLEPAFTTLKSAVSTLLEK
jgi:hypothetical protein